MPTTVLSRQRSWIAIFAVLAMVASIMVIATPAQAALQDTSATCPDSIPSAGFTDLGGLDAATVQAIDCLAFYDISKGTSATTYSPNASVARWQMALFLTRSLTSMGVALPSGADQGFTDIGGLDAATQVAINQLAQLNITKGTTATTFSPDDNVSRWQMALFLTRTLSTAGNTLPSGATQGFTDIGAYDAATQTAINQTVQLGVSNGTSATTFSPDPDTLRWHMALFLTRSLAADGVVASGVGNPITAFNTGTDKVTYSSGGVLTTDTYLSTDSFFVDGGASSLLVFEAALTVGDLISIVGDVWSLTNLTATSSGLISNVDMVDNFDFTEPVSGAVTKTWDYDADAFALYTVDGTSATLTAFNADVSLGDTVVITGGNGTTAAKTRIFNLTNGSAAGSVSTDGVGSFSMKPAGGKAWVDTIDTTVVGDVLTVGGVAKTAAAFDTAQTAGDLVTYSKKGGVQTIALTDQALALVSGVALHGLVAVTTFTIDDGTAVAAVIPHGATAILKVDGVVKTVAEFDTALTPGDLITYQGADGVVVKAAAATVSLTNANFSGIPRINVASTSIVVDSKAANPDSDVVNYAVAATTNTALGLTGTSNTWTVNGVSKTVAQFSAALDSIIAGATTGTVTVSQTLTKNNWVVTTP